LLLLYFSLILILQVDFEPDTGNSGSIRINYHRLYLGEAAQKSVEAVEKLL